MSRSTFVVRLFRASVVIRHGFEPCFAALFGSFLGAKIVDLGKCVSVSLLSRLRAKSI